MTKRKEGLAARRDFTAGDRFARLSFIERADVPSVDRVMWKLKCDCGDIVIRSKSSVISEKTRSCGCLRRETAGMHVKPIDIAGRKFGRLTALNLMPKTKSKTHRSWECLCECGNTTVVDGGNLRGGYTVSCGCFRLTYGEANGRDLEGRIFGRLTATARVTSDNRGIRWNCKCSCGGAKTVLAASLLGGLTISCGCASVDKPGLTSVALRAKRSAQTHVRRARWRLAEGRFTAEQISSLFEKQRGRCACCKDKLGTKFHRDHKMPLVLGGSNYIENIELLCSLCNLKKGSKHPDLWANQNGRLL